MPAEQFATVLLPAGSSRALWNALTTAGRSLTGATQVVVLRGKGADFFDGLAVDAGEGPPAEPPRAAIDWLGRPDLITIAAISGRATGAGLDVALACDLRLAAHDAELAPSRSVAGTALLGELMGRPRALALVVTGQAIPGWQAAETGLVNLSVESPMLDAAVADMVATVLRTPREVATVGKAVLVAASSNRRRIADELAAGIRLAANEP